MNKKLLIILGILALIVFASIGNFIGMYNNLQVMDETVNSNWAQVENQLQRRGDLIPNLVSTVKGYAAHEKQVFTSIAEARAKLSGAVSKGDIKNINQANSEFTGALSRLLAISENYPQLKADKSFLALQDELAGTENRLSVARRDYNESVKIIDAAIRTIPTNIIAAMAGIKEREYFKVEESKKETPKVNF
jgi:LemA protein